MYSVGAFSLVALFVVAFPPVGSQYGGVHLQLDSPPTDLQAAVFEDGVAVVVSAGNEIHLLDHNLTPISSIRTHDGRVGHRITISRNSSETVLVCKETYCTHYVFDWFGNAIIQYKNAGRSRGFNNFPLAIEPDGFYIATADRTSFAVEQFNDLLDSLRSYDWPFLYTITFKRQFLHGFVYEDNVYFVVQDNGTAPLSNNVRILRFCHEILVFDASYEAILDCGMVSANSKVEVSSSPLEIFGFEDAAITLAVTTNGDTSICRFSLDDINAEMDASYTQCSHNDTLPIPLVWYNERTCAAFNDLATDMCQFELNSIQPVPALATFNAVTGRRLLYFNRSEEVTAILTVKVDSSIEFLYVAYSTSNESHFLDKYHIRSSGTLELVTREQNTLSVTLLRQLNTMMMEETRVFGANANSVFEVPLESCSNYTTCAECASSKNPLCGWCTVEQYCSRDIDCPAFTHEGHWVNDHDQCIGSISLANIPMDVDLIQNVEVIVYPREAVLPTYHVQYECRFYHENQGNVTHAFTVPLTGRSCQLQQAHISDFSGESIDLKFSLLLANQAVQLFPSSSILTVHNCSLHTDCGSCVESSSSCGWCVHNRTCTGNPAYCRHEGDWRPLTDHSHNGDLTAVCPLVVTPNHGSYTLPVSVRRELILSTRNIPPEIPGYRYGCQLRYGDSTVLQLMSHYHNDAEFRCITSENQVDLSSDVTNGTEATTLELLWIRKADNSTVVLHSVKATLYSCQQLGTGCSNCLSANIGTGFECGWCDKLRVEDVCTVLDHCRILSTFYDQISECPLPVITSISPKSGPTLGGTVLTVRGSDLGAVASDISVELIKRDSSDQPVPCITDNTKYIPGIQVVCTTQEAPEGGYFAIVTVLRGNVTVQPQGREHIFTYAHPIVNSMEPMQGPKAGGTEITFQGSNLDIGSSGTVRVFIGDIMCDIKFVMSKTIVCVSRPVSRAASLLRTLVVIDNADMPSELYNYTENPVFTRVEPQNIIPAGGVTLTFRGNYLNVVLYPELIMTVDNTSLTGICTPKSSTILKCIAPKLPADVELEVLERKRNTASTISYTITMDGADGPNSSARDLQLTVKPDPEFFMLHMEDREYTLESGHTIRILGSNIDSVLPTELSVMIDVAPCTVVNDDITDSQLRCFPPDTVLPGDRLVTVFVGVSDLNYSVGFLRYNKARSSRSSNNDLLLIIIPALTGIIILMLTLLSVLFCAVGILIRRKRAYKAKQRLGEEKNDVELISVMPNMYNGSRHVVGEHEYDTIPDVLEQMQLQQMEMVTCAAQHGIPFTKTPAVKTSDNIYYSEDEGRGSSTSSGKSHALRPTSSSTSGGSRPHSSSTSGSLTYKPMKRTPLPPLPTSASDEYVAMHSYSVSTPDATTTLDSTVTPDNSEKPESTTATVVVHEPAAPDGDVTDTGAAGYDKLGPKGEQTVEDSAKDPTEVTEKETEDEEMDSRAPETLALTHDGQKSQDDSTV